MARDLRAVFTTPSQRTEGTASFLAPPPEPSAPGATPSSSTPTAAVPSGQAPYPLNPTLGGTSMSAGTLAGASKPIPVPIESAPPQGRGMLWAGVASALVVLSLIAFFALRPGQPTSHAVSIDPEAQLRDQYQPMVDKGQAAMAAGEPVRAIEYFEQALVVVPGDREIRKLREQAEQMILDGDMTVEEAVVRDRLASIKQALEGREYPHALALVQEVLELDPENDLATEFKTRAEAGLERERNAKDRVQQRFRNRPGSATTASGTNSAGSTPLSNSPAAGNPTSPAGSLTIDFFSEVSEGVLSIYVGATKFYHQSFTFMSEKSGVFKRQKKTSGRLAHTAEVPSGNAQKVLVYVFRNDETVTLELEGSFSADQPRTLKVRVDRDGAVTARLE